MPRPAKVCHQPGCPNLTPCPNHTRQPWANVTQRRPNALTGRARQQRNAQVIAHHSGICHICGQPGATQVDHIIPYAHGGTDDWNNLAPIHADPCHRAKTQQESAETRRTQHP